MAPLSKGALLRSLLKTSVSGLRSLSTKNLVFSQEVSAAISNDNPLVSLESTIITHGMPYPTNLNMAREVEKIIRDEGAIPATVALLDGRIHVGLDSDQLEQLSQLKRPAVKTSRRDLPYVLANKLVGGTTVSGTMIVSHMAGIEIFVTGGVGGVHRGASSSMDISADLTELGRTPVTVVCAGVKSILDIGLTLEYLETQGVCVATLCRQGSRQFPAFYSQDSGYQSPYNLSSLEQAAKLIHSRELIGLQSGILIGAPIPEEHSASGEVIEEAIRTALKDAANKKVVGKEVTPFILARLTELTGGESLRANLALVKNNAKEGAGIAVELAKIKNSNTSAYLPPPRLQSSKSPLVVGGCNFDFVVRLSDDEISLDGGTKKGRLLSSHGGVGHNVVIALARLGVGQPKLVSIVGDDQQGESVLRVMDNVIDTSLILVDKDQATATYTAVLDKEGECKFGVGDMNIHASITPDYVRQLEDELSNSPLVVADGNLSGETLGSLLEICGRHAVPLFYEPTDLHKATKPLLSEHHSAMTYCSPNIQELKSMLATIDCDIPDLDNCTPEIFVKKLSVGAASLIRRYGLKVLLVTLSEHGVLLVRQGSPASPLPLFNVLIEDNFPITSVWYPGTPCPSDKIVSVSGAGDCLTAGFITGVMRGLDQDTAVSIGMQAARISCEVSAAVPELLHADLIDWDMKANGILISEE